MTTIRSVARALAGALPFCITGLALLSVPACDDEAAPTAGPNGVPGDAATDPSAGGDGDPSGNGGGEIPADSGLPCDVREALVSSCTECHGRQRRFGAPMSLTTYEELHAEVASDPSRPTWELVGERIASTTDPMPPQGFDIEPRHHDALAAWVEAGAPRAPDDEQCASDPDPDPEPDPVSELPCTPEHEFRAFGNGPDGAYEVPSGGDGNFYTCFPFASPFDADEQITAMAPIIDQQAFLHHYILWRTDMAPAEDGPFPCQALPTSDSTFVAGWAPGVGTNVLPDDVGFETKPDAHYLLQMHYWNVAGAKDQFDESGVAMCSTKTPRTHKAGVIAVGPTSIQIPPRSTDVEVTGSCPSIQTLLAGGFTILGSSPHAHQTATRFKTEIVRLSGGTETLTHVDPWDFDNQTTYSQDPPVEVAPGDEVRVTCTYDNPTNQTVTWGENSEDEMCFDFMAIYPIDPWPAPRFCVL